jgi:GNAT superfamily N-acetyltransferase
VHLQGVSAVETRTDLAATPNIAYRPAAPGDSASVARFICIAAGGLYEFLLDDLIPLMNAADFVACGVSSEHNGISYRNCLVAFDVTSGEIVGVANAFLADQLKEERYGLLPAGRYEHVRAMLEVQDWGSMFLNALAVSDRCRGNGVGTRLLDWAEERAREAGSNRLSLHVWADNTEAVKFYTARGFVALRVAEVTPDARLPHVGGSLLMTKTGQPLPMSR